MRTVWKYDVPRGSVVSLQMPMYAEILHAAEVGSQTTPASANHTGLGVSRATIPGQLQMWALVDTEVKRVTRRFAWCGTGLRVDDGQYITTVLDSDGIHAWHLFEFLGKE